MEIHLHQRLPKMIPRWTSYSRQAWRERPPVKLFSDADKNVLRIYYEGAAKECQMPAHSGRLLLGFSVAIIPQNCFKSTTNLLQCTILGHPNPVLNSRK